MYRVALLVACGCGRLGFDAVSVDDAPVDAPAPTTCGGSTQAPDPLTIEGATFEFTSFENDRAAVAGVTVEAIDDRGDVRGSALSDAAGKYSLSIATGGVAPLLRLRYSLAGYFTSTVWLDAPLDRDLPLGDPAVLNPSDGPLWSPGAMGSVYGSAGTTHDPSRGTLNVNVIDCAEQPLAGVEVALDTTPEVVGYLGTNGMPAPALSETQAPFTFLIGYNAPAVPTTIAATAAGLVFASRTYPVASGTENTLVRVRPLAP